ncbi:amino acid adenylation domain-containing protein [Archangium lansingense]|uniref:non-ribosomal peptide synthetase n=1 Tax=Archangium lansingense TaxID=2995310 RepID=UPI003B7D89BB
MFVLQNAPSEALTLPGLTLSALPQSSGTAKFDWTLALTDTPNGFSGALEYNTDLFERDTVARAMEHLRLLLQAAVSNPETRLSELPLLSQAEKHKLLVELNDTRADYPHDALVHELFAAQAARTPGALAVLFGQHSLTYAELDARANQLAHTLLSLGVGPDIPVALCVEPSLEMVIGLLGILKAGGTYVPLEPSHPRERLAFMLEDCGAPLLLTQAHLRGSLPAFSGPVLQLDADGLSLSGHSTTPPRSRVTPDNLAYIIYTSGSTGRPKGVMVPHRGVPNLVLAQARAFGIRPGSRVLQFASFSFDASVSEVAVTLLSGATLCLARRDTLLPGPALQALLREQSINVVTFPPSLLAVLPPDGLDELHTVVSAGEACSPELVARWASPQRRFLNGYGPTETTVCATLATCEPDGQRPPIGRPLPNFQLYVLDERLQPVPTGVPGELYIGGVGVSRGYLHRPELTAEKFLPNPYSAVPGARLYRTGDLVRYRADGNLEYLGRTDFQVKVRGFRIELGELESVLDKHPGVRQGIVLVREDKPGDKRLVAYVVPSQQQAPTASELRAYLKEHLPEYMVPSAFVALEQVPLTPNGKVDRKALPAPEASASAAEYIAPRTPTEELLAGIWSEILSVPRVGSEDSFFELGGHSLLATQVLSRVRTTFQLELPVRALFEAPTLSALARKLDDTRSRQNPNALQAPPLRPAAHTDDIPLAFSQQRLWFLDQLEPGNPVYNIPVALRLSGRLDTEALRRAFEALVARHESLRTTFASRDGQPVQLIAPTLAMPLEVVDLSDVLASEREAQAHELTRQEAQRPFELAHGPLLRAALLRLASDDHVLLVTLHHIVSDGWSMGVLVREVAALYAAFASGQQPSLPPLPIQYPDFALWQRSWLQGEALDSQLRYWKQQLSGAPAHLELSTDKPRPPVQTFRGSSIPVSLPKALSESLKSLSTRLGVTPFMTLLAGFQVLLSRYSRQDDISVGSPIAGRRNTELEGLIGFFINTLVLRSRLSPEASFRELLLQVRDTTLAAYEHQDLPFEKLVEELQPQRDLSRPPFFQVMFILQNANSEALKLPGLALRPMEMRSDTAKFDWSLALADTPDGFAGGLEYNTDLFEHDTVARAMEHLRILLEAAVSNPETRLPELPLLSSAEKHKLLVEWNNIPLDYPREATLHELFESQVLRTPDAEALVDGSRSLTYAQLNTRANQLAHSLRALGVTTETPVGICSRRSADLVVGLLGILKAGGLYVPLDPAYPRERLGFIVEDAQLRFLVAQSEVTASLPEHSAHVLLLDKDSESLSRASTSNPSRAAFSSNLAYLIYTSGSTGRPKGVSIEHRNAVSFLSWARTVFSPELLSGLLASTSIAFDLSVFELFLPLSLGGTVILAGNALELPSLPAAQRVSLVNTVPSAMSELLRSGGLPSSVRVVNLAGEPLAASLVQQLYQQPGLSLVYDLYGPSETTTYSTFTLRHSDKPPTIGRPISGTQVYLLDERLQPVPTGVPGEVFISGAGVSRGYLGRPELTAERFIPNPFSTTPGARMYRTGDLAKYRADGNLEYLGRTDFQVKVRGFRIELGEIESVLDTHPGVRQVVVVAREDRPGDKRLVAYLTPSSAQAPSTAELRTHLKQHLPEHMVPSTFVVLEQLPLTPNGKINRKALPAPEASNDTAAGYIAPRTPTEEKLASIWSEVLSVPRVGAEDNFFELGGHSLLATRVLSRLRTAFQVELPVRALFEAPTLSALALKIDEAQSSRSSSRASPLISIGRTSDIPLAFSQQRLWFLDQLEPGSPVYNIPSALRFSGRLDTEALRRAFEALVARHESLRTTFSSRDGQPIQVISPTLSIPLEVLDLSDVPASEREARAQELAHQETQRPFELAHGPLLRTCLLRLAPDEHVLLVTMHHIVSDGWSMGVLVREVAALYTAFASGQQPSLPPLPIQYPDFALWQRSWLQGEVLDSQLRYWKQQLSGAPAHLELSTDKPRPPVQTFRGSSIPVSLPKALSESLKSLSTRLGVTPFMTLLAGFQVLLSRYSRQDDISVGSPIAGRRNTEFEGLIGFFINTLVLRSRLSPEASFRELLLQVRDTTLGAYEHQDLPFEKLVEELQPQRDLSRPPFFQVMFILQNANSGTLRLPGLSLHPVEMRSSTAKFDWTLALADTPDGFAGGLEYNTDLFEHDTVARAMEHLRILLEAAVSNPETRLSELPLLSSAEKHKLLVEWNNLPLDYPREATLHELFESQVLRTPDAEALVDGSRSLTYAQLNARANQLAHSLRTLGVTTETPVGICSRRSADLVVGLLGILKAGGLYVPLDPAYPRERLGFIVEDAQLRFLVAQSEVTASLPEHSAHVLLLDKDSDVLARASTSNPSRAAFSSNLAYLIYTSGSTGRPKGVSIEHRNAVSFLSWARTVFSPELLSGLLASTSIAFDLSVFELFLPLSLGGTVILAGNALELPSLPAAQRVSLVNTVPSAMSELLRSGGLPSSVRVVNLAGEPLAASLVQQLYQQPGLSLVYDLYGPSETTTYSTFTLRHSDKPPTIGRPISGTQLYLLDERLQPVPTGVPGEVFISGAGVSRGYLGRPELTAERFIPNPFSAEPGARMYRTGDLAKYRADGNLEYLGRTDFQVKVRGFRIELGEIESVLDTHPGVRQVVVVAREDRPGDKRLVAYLTPSGTQATSTSELRTHLKQHLPEHMVPSVFVVLEQLPLTPNGKINRKALPAPETSNDTAAGYIAPRTPTEEKLASIWSEVLSVPRVGAEDNFFELGGHSLLATRVLSRLRTAFQVELPVRALFEAPTLSALAFKLDDAHGRQARNAPQAIPLRPSPSTDDLPLAFSQQRLWFLDQLEPGSPAYNIPIALRLSGHLDTEALQRAFEALVARHESLRTTFATRDEQPVQIIAPTLAMPLEVLDLGDVPASEREAQAHELTRQEAQRPFELAHGPLLRASLLRLASDDHVLFVTMHHIVSDGWSMGVLVREVAALYTAFASGQQPSLPPLPIQYPDFALWQRSWLQGEALDSQLRYWKQQLSGAPAHLELSTDKPRPPVQTFRGSSIPVSLPKALSESLKSLSTRLGVTPFMTLLAGFQVLLSRYSRQDDISVGSPIAGRRNTELEGLIGLFINTLVLRSRLSPEASFRELLLQVRDTTLGAYEHQDLPFEKLVEELQPQRDLSRSPFFQVMFILQNAPSETLRLPGLTLNSLPQSSGTAKFDWTLALSDTPNGFSGALEYNTDLFEQDTVARAMEHLRLLLEAVVANPETRLSELPLLPAAEKHRLLVEWNNIPLDYPREATLHELFESQVLRTPDAEALVDGTRSLTYAELNTRANQLAHSLRTLGVTTETPVGICSRRSADLVVGLLGILKAGGLYVPLDPAYPRERLGFIVEDAQLRFLVAQSEVTASLPEHSAHVLLLDKDSDVLARASTRNPSRAAFSSNLAYLIYTSGSTGRPKGVSIEHRNAVSFLSWARTVFSPELLSGLLASTSIAFDLSVFELFLPLSLGGTVILAGNALELPSLPAAQRVSLVNTVPSAMSELLRSGGLPSSVRVVNLAGEPLAASLVQQLYQQPGLSLVYDLYGPSETTTYSTFTLRHSDKPPTIGRPISGTQVYLLDERLQPVPTGVPGEVFIAGAGVSRGYLGRPELTAERFIPNPFSAEPGARMYRTGDLAKYRADGNLEYLGRTDFQVKVRGFRIELGEIESVLDKHPGVRQVVVVAREDRPGDKRLVAYLTPSGPQAPSTSELRTHLKQHLPEHMVPSVFVVLEQLPLTPNGKINRKALPAPEASNDTAAEYIAPRTPTEELLAGIWAEVLSVPRVGIRDNFFELGGHSLLATRVTSRVHQALGRRLSVLTLFQNPTVELLAEALRRLQDDAESSLSLMKLREGEAHQRPLFLVHPAGGGVMSYTDLVGHLETTRPIYALLDPALHTGEQLPASVEAMARHYVAQIREVQPQGPYSLSGWSFGGLVAYEMARQLQAAGETVELLSLFDTHAPGTQEEIDELTILAAFCANLGLPWQSLTLEPERMLQLSARERLAYVLEKANAGLELEQAWRLFEVFQRHLQAQMSYTARPYEGSAVLFKASTQPEGVAPDGRLGWSAFITGTLDVQEVPGTHHTMLNEPHAASLAERLTQVLNTLTTREAA